MNEQQRERMYRVEKTDQLAIGETIDTGEVHIFQPVVRETGGVAYDKLAIILQTENGKAAVGVIDMPEWLVVDDE